MDGETKVDLQGGDGVSPPGGAPGGKNESRGRGGSIQVEGLIEFLEGV